MQETSTKPIVLHPRVPPSKQEKRRNQDSNGAILNNMKKRKLS
jgi:hypothetical protein